MDFLALPWYNLQNPVKGCRYMANKNKKRGFTLVELIVVLVILAVLAALLVPALTGYIDKAKKNQVIAETRMLTQAAQTELSTLYATDEFQEQKSASSFTVAARNGTPLTDAGQKLTNLSTRYKEIVSLSEVPSLIDGTGTFFVVADRSGAIHWTVYSNGKGYYGVFCKEDGSMTAFTKNELTTYSTYASYDGKVICTALSEPNGQDDTVRNLWAKGTVFYNLGIAGYTPVM